MDHIRDLDRQIEAAREEVTRLQTEKDLQIAAVARLRFERKECVRALPKRCAYRGDDSCDRMEVADGVCARHAILENWKMDCFAVNGVLCNVHELKRGGLWMETEEFFMDLSKSTLNSATRERLNLKKFDRVRRIGDSLAAGFTAATWSEAYHRMSELVKDWYD